MRQAARRCHAPRPCTSDDPLSTADFLHHTLIILNPIPFCKTLFRIWEREVVRYAYWKAVLRFGKTLHRFLCFRRTLPGPGTLALHHLTTTRFLYQSCFSRRQEKLHFLLPGPGLSFAGIYFTMKRKNDLLYEQVIFL